jgi:MATE family multidrug resistance protein
MGLIELVFIPFGEPLLELLGASEKVAPLAADYFAARVVGAAPALVMTALTQYLQGRSRTRAPMFAMIIANLVNVGLDPLFIYGGGPIPAMGVAGAGWAASVSFTCGALVLVWVAWPELSRTARRLERPLLARIWNLGFPLAGRATLEIASYLGFQGILAAIGDAHLAAHVLVVRTISISFMPGYAVSEAVAVLVGQAVGARRLELVAQIRAAALKIAVSFMCAWGVVFVLMPEALASLHSAPADVVAIAVDLFMVSAVFQLADAFAMVGLGILNGAGDTRFVLLATVSVAWLTKLPLGWALASEAGMGAVGAWWGIVAEVLVLWAVLAWRLRSGEWRRVAEAAQATLATAA